MTLRELRYLVAVAQHRHFGRAAEACHVTQPTLSAQLRKLEDYLGHTLVDRQAKQPMLTPIGEKIVERAQRLVAEADEIIALTRARRAPLEGALNIGVIPTLAPFYLPELLRSLRVPYPKLQLIVQEDLTSNLCAKLDEQMLDAALLALPAPLPPETYVERPLFDEPFWVAAPPDHAVATLDTVDDALLHELKLLLLTDGHCLRGQALAVCHKGEAHPDDSADCRATSLETLCQMVSAGFGCTLLPALAARNRPPSRVVLRPLSSGASRRIGLVWRRGQTRAAELELLAEALSAAIPDGTRAIDTAMLH